LFEPAALALAFGYSDFAPNTGPCSPLARVDFQRTMRPPWRRRLDRVDSWLRRSAPTVLRGAFVCLLSVVFFAWLLLFLIQSRLIATRHVAWHRRLGLASVAILAWMIPLAYTATIAMVRRGYDLSGDLRIDRDPPHAIVFQLCNLLIFSALAIAALAYRRRPEIHKRLMLFANIELMPAPLAHLIGHTPWLASAASSDCHGANLDLRNRCHRPGLAAGEASSPAHVGTCDFEDGLRAARGRSFGFERGLASLCLPAGWIALNETGERDELHV